MTTSNNQSNKNKDQFRQFIEIKSDSIYLPYAYKLHKIVRIVVLQNGGKTPQNWHEYQ